jgi:hypothetical protein
MRRHYANYLKGIINIKPLRSKLVMLNTMEEIEETLEEFSSLILTEELCIQP